MSSNAGTYFVRHAFRTAQPGLQGWHEIVVAEGLDEPHAYARAEECLADGSRVTIRVSVFRWGDDHKYERVLLLEPRSRRSHSSDQHCAKTIVDDVCLVCKVSHVEECSSCGGRGYHREGCREIERGLDDAIIALRDESKKLDAEAATVSRSASAPIVRKLRRIRRRIDDLEAAKMRRGRVAPARKT